MYDVHVALYRSVQYCGVLHRWMHQWQQVIMIYMRDLYSRTGIRTQNSVLCTMYLVHTMYCEGTSYIYIYSRATDVHYVHSIIVHRTSTYCGTMYIHGTSIYIVHRTYIYSRCSSALCSSILVHRSATLQVCSYIVPCTMYPVHIYLHMYKVHRTSTRYKVCASYEYVHMYYVCYTHRTSIP